ncbi:MAG: META domain-containing protein [Methanoregula sp.]|nr:META domain-containing protein [Methanoregula sp.]
MDDTAPPDTAQDQTDLEPPQEPGKEPGKTGEHVDPVAAPAAPMGRGFWLVMGLIGIMIILIVFAQVQGYTKPVPASLSGTNWTLDQYADENGMLHQVRKGTVVNATFGLDGGMLIEGRSGCNWYSANYSVTGSQIAIYSRVTTDLYCTSPGVMDIESTYMQDLTNATSYRLRGDYLYLYNLNQKSILIFLQTT